MWRTIKRADLDRVRDELSLRREALLKRHAEELAGLASDQANLEMLDRLAGVFARRFAAAGAAADPEGAHVPQAIAPPEPPQPLAQSKPVALPKELPARKPPPLPSRERPVPDKTPPKYPLPEKRKLSGTNFEIFSRAVSKSVS